MTMAGTAVNAASASQRRSGASSISFRAMPSCWMRRRTGRPSPHPPVAVGISCSISGITPLSASPQTASSKKLTITPSTESEKHCIFLRSPNSNRRRTRGDVYADHNVPSAAGESMAYTPTGPGYHGLSDPRRRTVTIHYIALRSAFKAKRTSPMTRD
jgi:hypothetical protein